MCGIAGIVDYKRPIDQDGVKAMTSSLVHRGPDDFGHYFNKFVGLGHRRLSIIDLTSAGKQPMQSNCGRYTLIYNGEMYNYIELRDELRLKGYSFASSSDTEVVLYSLIEEGIDVLSKFNGMFSLALWDNKENNLLLVRDRFGIKPLYYISENGSLIFGSEIKAIESSNRYAKDTNYNALHEYMWFGNALGDNTLYEDINKVLPGQYIIFSKNGVKKNKYWSVENTPENHAQEITAIQDVGTLLRESVKRHLLSDVPVAVFLSGGIDSSAITALASKEYEGTLKTFAVGFDFNKGISELDKARFIAEQYSTDHHELHIKGNNLIDVVRKMISFHDEPFADAANIPLHLLCDELKNDVKVVLQGDGGDEIFAGYRRYNSLSIDKIWMVLSILGLQAQRLLPKSKHYDRLQRYFYAMSRFNPGLKMALLLTHDSTFNSPMQLISDDIKNKISQNNPYKSYYDCNERFTGMDAIQKMLYTDCEILLPNTYLEKVDRSTMASSIEVRVPFLDKELTDYVMGLPSSYKVKRGQKKWLLRQSMRGIVPDKILDAPKSGFSVPYSAWLKKPLAGFLKEVLFCDLVRESSYFNNQVLEKKVKEHISGERNNEFMLWKALYLGLWLIKRKGQV